MQSLAERERSFEAEFKHKQDLAFLVMTRRDYLFGLRMASRLNLFDGEAEVYANNLVTVHLRMPAEDDLIAKVKNDLREKGVHVSDDELLEELKHHENEARCQIVRSNA